MAEWRPVNYYTNIDAMTKFNTLSIKQHEKLYIEKKNSNAKFTDNPYILSVHNIWEQDPMHASFL